MFLIEYARFTALENMAIDLRMLDNWGLADCARLRFYGWQKQCRTCGRFQTPSAGEFGLPDDVEVTRRPTGGGLVLHGVCDITYAFVLPKQSPLCSMRARESYKVIHESIADAFEEFGVSSNLLLSENPRDPKKSQCFESPSFYDVIYNGRKLAGAAQKRDKFGLLTQGSIDVSILAKSSGKNQDFEALRVKFCNTLALAFADLCNEKVEKISLPEFLQ